MANTLQNEEEDTCGHWLQERTLANTLQKVPEQEVEHRILTSQCPRALTVERHYSQHFSESATRQRKEFSQVSVLRRVVLKGAVRILFRKWFLSILSLIFICLIIVYFFLQKVIPVQFPGGGYIWWWWGGNSWRPVIWGGGYICSGGYMCVIWGGGGGNIGRPVHFPLIVLWLSQQSS